MKLRHKLEVFILFWLVFIAFVTPRNYITTWIVLALFWGVPCLFEWLFLGDNAFLLEPNYKNWQKANEFR